MRGRIFTLALMASTAITWPTIASADPVTAVAIIGTALSGAIATSIGGILGAVVGAAVSLGFGLLGQLIAGRTDQQLESRTRDFDTHPPFRFAFGEFPQEGTVVFHHSEGPNYYVVYLLNSLPSEEVNKIVIQGTIDLDIVNEIGANLYDMQSTDNWSNASTTWNERDFRVWIGLGEQTQPPQGWINAGVLSATDTWKGSTVAFCQFQIGSAGGGRQLRLSQGSPPPLRFWGKWSKLYDPRKDSTSGVAGASGTHRIDDRTTWEYTSDGVEIGSNPALAWLMLATHEYALGFDQEMIPIQQVADAVDACGAGASASATINPVTNAGTSPAAAVANGVTISGFSPEQIVRLTLPSGQTFGAWSPWGDPSPANPGTSGTSNQFRAAPDGDTSAEISLGSATTYDGYEAARAAFGTELISGGSSYTLYIVDSLIGDNAGELEVSATANPVYRCDGLVTIEERDFSLFDPVLACCAGHLDTTDGLLGLRVGTWTAPSDTLTQPVGDEIEILGARDAGFDRVVGKFIARDRDYQEDDGPGYALRAGNRTHPLQGAMVREREQMGRLEKVTALRSEPNRTITAVWDGRESTRRVGERVNFALSGFARAESTYVIDRRRLVFQPEEDGVRVETEMTLIEDIPTTYGLAADEAAVQDDVTLPTVEEPTVAAPTISAEQSDYRTVDDESHARLAITVGHTDELGEVRIEYSADDGANWTPLTVVFSSSTSATVYLDPAIVGVTYIARARREDDLIGESDWVLSDPVTIVTPVIDYSSADYSAEYA